MATGTTIGSEEHLYLCPICKKVEAYLSDFNLAYCPRCNFYWHFWMNKDKIQREINEFLKKRGDYPRRFKGIFK